MRRYLLLTSAVAVLMGCLSSCSSEEESLPIPETNSVTFSIGINAQTRAAQALDVNAYDAKMYLFEEKKADDGTLSYSYKNEVNITASALNESDELTIGGLTEGKKYKAVFLARPKNQTPALPTFSTTKPSYKEAKAQYISNNEIDKDIFRSIVSFTFSSGMETQSTVLTRQNGALEVRLKNMTGVKSLKLHALGHQWMYLEDGTGGMVITDGDETRVALEKNMGEEEILQNPQDVRIRLNILPQEDITSKTNDDFYLEITLADKTTKKYPIKSDQRPIPIYPNQVTWLTLTDMDGFFDVNFDDNGINLDDNLWDGWDEYYVEYGRDKKNVEYGWDENYIEYYVEY